jgi:hypothetical protein
VDALEEPPVPSGREHKVLVVGQTVGPLAADDAHGQVLVDHDHCPGCPLGSGFVVVVATEDRVGLGVGIESGLELVGQVPGRDPGQHLFARVRQAGITGPAAPAALF